MSAAWKAVWFGVIVLAHAVSGANAAYAAGSLVADLSSKEVAITTGFTGTEVLLFGAVQGSGDIIVVVRGPKRREVVRRKVRIAGVWVNGDEMAFDGVPAYYRIASTRPLGEIAPEAVLAQKRIGAARLDTRPVGPTKARDVAAFRDALLRNKTRAGLYSYGPQEVRVIGGRLFRTNVLFPVNVPTGPYLVEVYLMRDHKIVNIEMTRLAVRKVGLGAEVFSFAHQRSALYGVIAIVIALLAGWAAGALFRKA